MAESYVVLNRGPKTFTLKPGPNGETRLLPPNASIECLDEKEYKLLMGYEREIVDANKVMPANAKKVAAMEAEINRLKNENARLEKAAPATSSAEMAPEPPPEPAAEESGGKKKKGK